MINSPIKNFNKETRKLIKRWMSNNVETLSIGRVVNVSEYKNNRLVDVLPLPMEKQADGQVRVPDTIYRCPVILEGNLDGYLSFPIKVGDKVALGFCKQSLSEYLFAQKVDQYLPEDLALFGANDAIVLGFIAQAGKDKEVSPSNFQLNYQNSYLEITPNNAISLYNSNCSLNQATNGTITATNGVANAILNASGEIDLDNGSGNVNIDSSGTITLTNGTATVTINAGAVTITAPSGLSANGATINASGNVITASGSNLDAIYQAYNTHTHFENNSVGDTDTDPPTQTL